MSTVQLLIDNASYAAAVERLLTSEAGYQVCRSVEPDYDCAGVLVADSSALSRFPSLLLYPERLVAITRNDPEALSELLERNVRAVVFDSDPPSTAVLAIISAGLSQAARVRGNGLKPRMAVVRTRAASPTAAQVSPTRAN